jgi:RimJ/RimL family protein N-acetyltransferase
VSETLLSDPKVTLRPWTLADAEAIVECIDGDPEIARWLDHVPQPYSLEDARTFSGGGADGGRRQDWAMYSLLPGDLA